MSYFWALIFYFFINLDFYFFHFHSVHTKKLLKIKVKKFEKYCFDDEHYTFLGLAVLVILIIIVKVVSLRLLSLVFLDGQTFLHIWKPREHFKFWFISNLFKTEYSLIMSYCCLLHCNFFRPDIFNFAA
jgi:hypothetical protein